jgi:hypothetical protein
MEPTRFKQASTHASNTLTQPPTDDDAEPASFREVFPLLAILCLKSAEHKKGGNSYLGHF